MPAAAVISVAATASGMKIITAAAAALQMIGWVALLMSSKDAT
jgi:hypothetical protein